MLEVRNHTPLNAALIPALDKEGRDYAAVIMKGKFTIVPGQPRLVFSDEPAPIIHQDQHYGEPSQTSVRYESDAVPYKRGTDIIVIGHAYAPNQRPAYSVDVSVQVGTRGKTCRVFGDRVWEKSPHAVLTLAPGAPQPFERVPLLYEHAYGGIDPTRPEDKSPEFSPHNPVGKGYLGPRAVVREGLPLPNIEDPRHLIQRWDDRPLPAGLGFLGRAWQPRVALAGTYDDAWKKQRLPLLPHDFNDRYFNGAHPDLIVDPVLQGGEHVTLTHLSADGALAFDLPIWRDPITVYLKGQKTIFPPVLDTVVIEPDSRHVLLTWRATIPCPRQFLYIDTVIIGRKRMP
jgi:hypothetical protein